MVYHGRHSRVLLLLPLLLVAGALFILSGTASGHRVSAQRRAARPAGVAAVTYECPMHPEVTSSKRGKCPKCGMTFRAKSTKTPQSTTNMIGNQDAPASPSGANTTASPAASQTRVDGGAKTESAAAKYFPNHVLLTQDNKPVHFYDDLLKGKVVLINFIFTTCPGVCSPMTANLARVQNHLAEHLDREVVMLSISVDPLTDTPDVLKKYADKFKIKPGWYFLTGDKKNIDWVLYKLGGYVEDKQQHSSILIIGNEATGEWIKVYSMANPTEIASAVTKLLALKPK